MVKKESQQAKRRRTGNYLMLFFFVGWIFTQVSIQFYQSKLHGYGSGFGDGGRLPPEVIEQYGVKDPIAASYATANKATQATWLIDGEGFAPDTVRILVTLLLMGGIIFFWHSIMIRVGTF